MSVVAELAQYGPHGTGAHCTLAQAVDYCRRLAQSQYENFWVASGLIPRRLRPHFWSVYAYCRWADDLADETNRDDSLRLLDWWQIELDRCYAGQCEHPVFVALAETIAEFQIPRQPLADLLSAFRQDQHVTRYDTPQEVLDYCRNSANPVGRLVLYLAQSADAARVKLADSICTGLQLANFCQDVARDWDRGRIYLPRSVYQQFGYDESMFERRLFNDAFHQTMITEVDRAESFLAAGEPLAVSMPRDLQVQTAMFVAGGKAILQAIRQADYDVWRARPTVSKPRQVAMLARSWWSLRGARRAREAP